MPEGQTHASTRFRLRLYVMSETPRSDEAFKNVSELAESHIAGRYDLEVIDVRNEPFRALADGALMIPTLILSAENGERHIVGDLSDTAAVLSALGLTKRRQNHE